MQEKKRYTIPSAKKNNSSRYSALLFVLLFTGIGGGLGTASFAQSSLTLDSVSVNGSNHVVLGWTLQTQAQEGFIEIHRQLPNGLYAPIMQLPLSQTHYTDTDANAQNRSWSYYLVARHPNGDNIAVSNQAHATIFLNELENFPCNRQNIFKWQNYRITTSAGTPQPLPLPFDQTEIWASFENQQWYQIGNSQTPASAFIAPAEVSGQYCYRIRTVKAGSNLSSTSNALCTDVVIPSQPSAPVLRKLSLDLAGEDLALILETDPSASHDAYVVLKQDVQNQLFLSLDTLHPVTGNVVFTESNSPSASRKQLFKVHTLDSCGFRTHISGPWETLFLEVEPLSGSENRLQWNTFEGWEVEEYVVLRADEAASSFEIIASLSSSQTQFIDPVSGAIPGSLDATYRVMALGQATASSHDTILSNIARVVRESHVFIPNAFRPGSHIADNQVFMPRFVNFTPQNYQLSIFNKWGEKIFGTSDPLQGWDGFLNGNPAPAGVYHYVLVYTSPGGGNQSKSGPLMLVR